VGNVSLSTSQAATYFASYSANNTGNDYHLRAAASALIGLGANQSSFFGVDFDGKPRPATGAWDIGPYQYIP
jgi:hypothetical protein